MKSNEIILYETADHEVKLNVNTDGDTVWLNRAQLAELFGNEKDDSFKGSIANIYQEFGGMEIYPSLEEKAANLLYFVTKNHSFSDGNKRIAAAMFLYFLDMNGALFHDDAKTEKAIADQTLAALTIMIAESNPDEKEMMIKVIMNCMV